MRLPPGADETIRFACNVCGQRCAIPAAAFHRELAACDGCGSTPRFRGIVHALSIGLFGRSIALADFPHDKRLRGVGMSDWPGYAEPLGERLDYRNTFYHTTPRLDIAGEDWRAYRELDFVISSEVFEHIDLPLDTAFGNLRRMLRRGGTLVFSVPYIDATETVEHYPTLDRFGVCEVGGRTVLVVRTRAGEWEVHETPVFHGGSGETLERRIFAECDVRRRLADAGFEPVVVHDRPVTEVGYYWPPMHDQPGARHAMLAYVIGATAA